MALTATVTKKSVSLVQEKLYNVTFNLILTDTTEVFNKDYSIKYRTGQNISTLTNKFIKLMQDDIDKYKAEQVIFNATQLNTAVNNVNSGLNL